MNKKGFTLVELMGVIALIGIVVVITVPVVKNITKDAKQKGFEKQINAILVSAKNWAVQNTDLLPTDSTPILVTMDTLKKEGFLENKEIINPIDNEEIDACVEIKYSVRFNQYEYKYNEDCAI